MMVAAGSSSATGTIVDRGTDDGTSEYLAEGSDNGQRGVR